MGFHVIILKAGNQIEHRYEETYEKLADISELKKDSIIYEGEPHWKPVLAGQSNRYKHFTQDWFRAGLKAQQVFQEQAQAHNLILEVLKQDQDSFKSYTNHAKKIPIKRGDFLIRNVRNIEVDVKCRGFQPSKYGTCFDFKIEDFNKHLNMISFTHTPIIIAVYEREPNTDKVKTDQLFMFEIQEMKKYIHTLETPYRRGVGRCYRIPICKTEKGFALIEHYKQELSVKEQFIAAGNGVVLQY